MPPVRTRARRLIVISIAIQALFVFFFVFPGHEPKPNGLPVGAVGPRQAVDSLARQLTQGPGDVDVERYATVADARRAIGRRDVYGAFVLGPEGSFTVLTTPAASFTVATLLADIGRRGGATRIEEVVPLDPDDPRGATLNVLVLPIIVTSILSAIMGAELVADLALAPRVAVVGVAGIGAALADLLIVKIGLGALPGSLPAEAAFIALAFAALSLTAGGILRVVGPLGTFLAFALFLMLGNPASGLATAPELLPSPWKEIGPLLPPGALGGALRNVAYFDGHDLALPLVVLAVWIAIGVTLIALGDRRRAPAPAPSLA
jgi:prepilin-type processing-associated H-X9-DG protein